MQIRCCSCFQLFDNVDSMCPHCGFSNDGTTEEAYYLQPGTQLKGNKYIVGQKVGQGGFGIIYKAWDTNLQRIVAIKEFFPLQMVTRNSGEKQVVIFSSKREKEYERHLNKFRREAKIMSLFTDSVNCINTYDRFDENGTAYIAMEYFSAPTLKEFIKARKGEPLPEKEAVTIITQVLSGLKEIHSKGVYHLDIALDNIFLPKKDGEIKAVIYDFGAARMEKEQRKGFDEDIILKPGFAPPEQYRKNGKIGPWTDIYAVGANLYYLLTGVVPVEATDREREDTMEKPAQLVLVSPAINNVVLRAMALSTEIRYQNAEAFLEDLKKEKVRNDEEEAKYRRKVRNRFLALVGTVLVAAAAFVVFLGVTKGKIAEDEITVWVVSDTDLALEQERYEAAVAAFREFYPQISVNVVAMTSKELDERFLAAKKQERPDLLETTNASAAVLGQCVSLSSLIHEIKGDLAGGLANGFASWGEKSIPAGMYVPVIYKQNSAQLESLSPVSSFSFLSEGKGYMESDTTVYSIVQNSLAGRYEVTESTHRTIYLADAFSVYVRSMNKEKAAKALLGYFLTDACQEILHITFHSTYLPVSEAAFDLYVEQVYSELDFLKNSLEEYGLEEK